MPVVTVQPTTPRGSSKNVMQAFRVVANKPTADTKLLITVTSAAKKVTVTSLKEESILRAGGLMVGDEIVEVNGTAVEVATETTAILKAAVGEIVMLVQGKPSLNRKKPASFAGDPIANAAAAPKTAAAPSNGDAEKTYELEVPAGTTAGSKLKLTIPGMSDKVIITVPEGAGPGATISFTLPKGAAAGAAPAAASEDETKAAIVIQARLRGKSVRKADPASLAPEPTVLPASEVVPVAPAYTSDTRSAVWEGAAASPPTTPKKSISKFAQVAAAAQAQQSGGLGGLFKRSLTSLSSVFASGPAMPATAPESASAYELFGISTAIMAAWESADFDTFVANSLPSVVLQLSDMTAEGAQGVWDARHEHTHEGTLSLDTMMAQVDGESATVVCLERIHDTDTSGMIISHAWLRLSFDLVEPEGAPANGGGAAAIAKPAWKLSQLERDSIWSGGRDAAPPEDDMPAEMRYGSGRTLRACTDVSSLSAVLCTSWVAGDRTRFESVMAPTASVEIKAFEIKATSSGEAYESRDKLLKHGSLISFNSPMVDAEGDASGAIHVLAHAHLYDVSSESALGQPTAHMAMQITYEKVSEASDDLHVTSLVADVMWLGEGRIPETEGLSFETPPLNSIYTRALTFVKSWETSGLEGITSLSTRKVKLEVMSGDNVIEPLVEGSDKLLAYRESLGEMGMLTVDSVKVTPTSFEAIVHEYGIDLNQHGLPRKHEVLKLDFEAQRDGSMLVSKVYIDIVYFRKAKRASLVMDQDVKLLAEL